MSPNTQLTIGVIAACLTTGAWLPQLVRTFRTKSAHDFSWSYLVMFFTGVFLWAIYGFMRHDIAVIGANVIAIVLVLGVILVKMFQSRT
jgi:MtN3 and saliva related transmembrane protein